MLQVDDKLEEFLKEIRHTDVAKKYDEIRAKIMENPQLAEQIDDFRRQNFRMQMQTFPDQMMDASDHFAQDHARFRENPLVQEFLEAELAYCRMLQEITSRIFDVIPLELGEVRSWL